MRKEIKWLGKKLIDLIKTVMGVILIVVGIAGLFLPIMPGIILIIIGVILLDNKRVKKFFDKIIRRLKRGNKKK